MILPPIVQLRQSLRKTLQTFSPKAGATFELKYRRLSEDWIVPQSGSAGEVYMMNAGERVDVQQNLTACDNEQWRFVFGVTCSKKLLNDDTPIEDIVDIALNDLRNILYADLTQGLPGICIYTVVGDSTSADNLQQGFFAGQVVADFWLRNERPEVD